MNVAAVEAGIAHETFDERNLLAVGRDPRLANLQLGSVQLAHLAGSGVGQIQTRNPPVVVAGPAGGGGCPSAPVRCPVVLIDVHVGGRNRLECSAVQIDQRNPLLVDLFIYHPASGVMGCSGPAIRGIPEMKSSARRLPSGEKLGVWA